MGGMGGDLRRKGKWGEGRGPPELLGGAKSSVQSHEVDLAATGRPDASKEHLPGGR